jgi:hypothetical protein
MEPEIVARAAAVIAKLAETKQLSSKFSEVADLIGSTNYYINFETPTIALDDGQLMDIIVKKKSTGLYTELDLLRLAWPDLEEKDLLIKQAELDEAAEKSIARQQAMMGGASVDKEKSGDKGNKFGSDGNTEV